MLLSFQGLLKESVFPAVTKQKAQKEGQRLGSTGKSEKLCPSVVRCSPALPSPQHVQETYCSCPSQMSTTFCSAFLPPCSVYSNTPKIPFVTLDLITERSVLFFPWTDNTKSELPTVSKVMRKGRFLHENVFLRFFHCCAWQLLDMSGTSKYLELFGM